MRKVYNEEFRLGFISQNIDLDIWKIDDQRNMLKKLSSSEGCGNTSKAKLFFIMTKQF